MNNISEKQTQDPLLPLTNPINPINPIITHTTTTQIASTTAPTRSDKFFAAMDAFAPKMERFNRALDSIAMSIMIATQILCLGVVLWYSAKLAYLFTTSRRANTPELALEVVCYIAPFLAFGTGVRFMELVSVFFRYREVRTVPLPAI
ncbi:hypothetical protein VE01_04867 [Pseudogymnoascus verrucosus]|uniref:Uncharacterized protein n=1 Tax=Pseudogymnoascus verrucosus TaxID=342668 RepID=A0A1B8GMN6_9PEZI|nr:uncharacterized protein VE01_04867 [Pseudogymnoascus verrucosus]OBT97076.1 hypothetical protein VE01_04867 [Pseudogymnoascus verrucosus]